LSDQNHPRTDKWHEGATYEPYVGRWSRPMAREFLRWLNVPSGSRWLDVGCGTGALSQTILQAADPRAVKGIDASATFIAYAREHVVDERVSFEVGNAQDLPLENSQFDAVVAGLVLNFIPDKPRALSEMMRVAKPDGIIAAYVWDYADQMQMMRVFWDAVITLHPDALELDEGRRFPLCHPDALADLFQSAGLEQVETRSIDIHTKFQDFDDYWSPFLGGVGPAPAYVMSLIEQDRSALRDDIRARLPVASDGTIDLIARAWAVRGRPTESL
jgi:SAM-dependent methyltransferase